MKRPKRSYKPKPLSKPKPPEKPTAEGRDEVTPYAIEHSVDEIWVEGRLRNYYNFIDYHFEIDGDRYRARTYLSKIDVVSICGPFQGEDLPADKPIDPRLIGYFRRRFRVLEAMDIPGYVKIMD